MGTAKISFDIINSGQWQTKKDERIQQFKHQGIELEDDNKTKNDN